MSSTDSKTPAMLLAAGGAVFALGFLLGRSLGDVEKKVSKKVTKPILEPDRGAVIVIDPYSTGGNVAHELMSRHIDVVRVLSRYLPPSVTSMVDESAGLMRHFSATIQNDPEDLEQTITAIQSLPYPIMAVISGSELGVELADMISERLNLRTNGTELTSARRDKYRMGEQVRKAGIRAVKQCRGQDWESISTGVAKMGLTDFKDFKVIIKPIRSAGSDSVYLCSSMEELQEKFESIIGQVNLIGISNLAVVVQEYLEGKEYVVDTVSRDGVHKVAAIWEYDKRTANGANFVYHGMRLVAGDAPQVEKLVPYQFAVLDALGIMNGPAHGEIMLTKTGPCLIEVGARPHGAEGTFIPVAQKCIGYDQVTLTADAYVDPASFARCPTIPTRRMYGMIVDLVSHVEGQVVKLPHVEAVRTLQSFTRFNMLPKVGEVIHKTVDCFTAVGSVALTHPDEAVLEADFLRIRHYEKNGFFQVEPLPPVRKSSRAQ